MSTRLPGNGGACTLPYMSDTSSIISYVHPSTLHLHMCDDLIGGLNAHHLADWIYGGTIKMQLFYNRCHAVTIKHKRDEYSYVGYQAEPSQTNCMFKDVCGIQVSSLK
jgi:hypothetical protein